MSTFVVSQHNSTELFISMNNKMSGKLNWLFHGQSGFHDWLACWFHFLGQRGCPAYTSVHYVFCRKILAN